ncbi:unnamed protein product [Paramecium sonneborni]|uniref:Uncharacterized protein n=1 Tax=Paramecium sonneborni TaxID=65129 RepID=A0A8S1LL37_9CILI|nr:unnamed protein product [Paramecium sonneborni]
MSWGEPTEVNIKDQTSQRWSSNNNQQQDCLQGVDNEEERKGKGKKGNKIEDSPPPIKRIRPNPIVIVVDDDDDCETQSIIINECPQLQSKGKGLIQNTNQQICYQGNIKIEDCVLNIRFISFDMKQNITIGCIDEYSIENAKDRLKKLNDQVIVGLVEGLDEENQKAINKLADSLLDKQQTIRFKDVSLFSIKQLYKIENKTRLVFVKQMNQ